MNYADGFGGAWGDATPMKSETHVFEFQGLAPDGQPGVRGAGRNSASPIPAIVRLAS